MARRWLLMGVVAALLAAGLYAAVVFAWPYSTGERVGWLQKFSRKGWVCKTWEGELSMVSMPGASPEKFLFTVRDPAVAARVEAVLGARVKLDYEQHRGAPGSCFGETEYWVTNATPVAGP